MCDCDNYTINDKYDKYDMYAIYATLNKIVQPEFYHLY